MIKFGIRQSFNKIEQVEERYSNIKVPVEVALPYYWDIYEPIRVHLTEIADKIRSYRTEVLSVHAVQSYITDENFLIWGKEIADFAKAINTTNITLHPNNVKKGKSAQEYAIRNLKYFADLYKDEIVFCIETFKGSRRVFTPDEIVNFNLPMTLDTSHIHDDKKIWGLLKDYGENIKNVHLSAKDGNKQHLPIDNFCKEVVIYLMKNKWNGNVILEYLPEFHNRLLTDLEFLQTIQ